MDNNFSDVVHLSNINEFAKKIIDIVTSKYKNTPDVPIVVTLDGNLGAGKTTIVRNILTTIDNSIGQVISPTYNILQLYQLQYYDIYHYDLYRIQDVKHLNEIGFLNEQDYCNSITNKCNLYLVEWPGVAETLLPKNVIDVRIDYYDELYRTIKVMY